MKKIILLSFFIGLMVPVLGQVCVPGTLTSPKNAYIIPDSATNFANACPGTYYEQIMYIKAAKDTVIVLTTPISGVLTADIDSFVVNGNITGLPSYLNVESVPAKRLPAGASSPKSNFDRLVIPGDSMACVKISGTVPVGTPAATLNLSISLRVYTSNIHSADILLDALIPNFYPGRVTDTLTNLTDYRIVVAPTPCWATAVSDLSRYGFEVAGALPNPASQTTRIALVADKSMNVNFQITNAMGEMVLSKTISAQPGMNYIPVDLAPLAEGMYLYSIGNQIGKVSKKLIVQH